jgi:hypothetical protein
VPEQSGQAGASAPQWTQLTAEDGMRRLQAEQAVRGMTVKEQTAPPPLSIPPARPTAVKRAVCQLVRGVGDLVTRP